MANSENKIQWTNSLGQPVGFPLLDWQRRPDPPRTTMEGRSCRVEPLNIERHLHDLYEVFKLDTEGENWTYVGYGPFPTFDSILVWAKQITTGSDAIYHAIIDKRTGRAVGTASYRAIDSANGVIEVGGVFFSNLLQRTTIATEAIYLMMRRLFDELGYRRCQWQCHSLNAKSRAAAERFGFRYEGIFRQARVVKGHSRDTAWFSIIDLEWPRLKQAYERWLDPKNFDANGNQREKLSDLTRQ